MRFIPLEEFTYEQRHKVKQAVDLRLSEHGLLAGTVVATTEHIEALLGDDWRARVDAEISSEAQGMWRDG